MADLYNDISNPEYDKNFKISGKNNNPTRINFNTLGYHKQRTIIKGVLISTKYWRNYEDDTYSDLILEERREFERDEIEIIIYRLLYIDYYFEDGTLGLTHDVGYKYYLGEESIKEGTTRRTNVINEAKYYLVQQVGQSYAFDFLLGVKVLMGYYYDGYTQPLRDAIDISTKTYMTTEIKETLIEILTL